MVFTVSLAALLTAESGVRIPTAALVFLALPTARAPLASGVTTRELAKVSKAQVLAATGF
jgi:hypothetical protein